MTDGNVEGDECRTLSAAGRPAACDGGVTLIEMIAVLGADRRARAGTEGCGTPMCEMIPQRSSHRPDQGVDLHQA